MLRSPCECIKSLQLIVHCAFIASRSCLFPSLRSQTESLIYAISTRIEEDDVTTKAESGANQNVAVVSLSLSLMNPIHSRGESKSEEKSHQKHPGDKDDECIQNSL